MRKIILPLLIIALLQYSNNIAFSQSVTPNKALEEVQLALIKGDVKLSQELLEPLMESEKENPLVWYYKGLTSKQMMNFKSALQSFRNALNLDPGNVDLYKQMAQTAYDLEEYRNCIIYTDSILSIDSTNFISLRIKAQAFQKLNNFEQSRNAFLKLHKNDSVNAWYIKQLGGIAMRRDSLMEALEWYSLATELDSMDMRSYMHQGNIFVKAEMYKEGLPILSKAINRDSSYALLYRFRGSLDIMGADFEGAENDFKKAIELGDSISFTIRHYGLSLYKQSKYDEALPVYQAAIEIDKDNALAWYYLGFCYKWQEDVDEAILCLDRALELSATKNLPNIYDGLGQFHSLKRNFQKSIHNYSRAYEWNPNNPVPLAQLGMLVEQSGGKNEHAKTYYKSYLEKSNPLKNAYLINYVNNRLKIINEKLFMEGKLEREE